MNPDLNLPDCGAIELGKHPTDPEAVKSWLSSLPPLDSDANVSEIIEALAELCCADLDEAQRLRSATLYHNAIAALEPALARHPVDRALPLLPHALKRYSVSAELDVGLANVYKRIVVNTAGQQDDADAIHDDHLMVTCYWAIYYLGEALRCAYETYTRPAAGVWHDIHQLFDYARFRGLERGGVAMDRQAGLRRSIRQLYKRLVLLGLSDPPQLPFRTIIAVHSALDRWALRVNLLTRPRRDMKDCLFVLDPEMDRPALPVLSGAQFPLGANQLFLDTSGLIRHLREKLGDAVHMTFSGPAAEMDRLTRAERIETLHNLIAKWNSRALRGEERHAASADCELIAGLKSISYVLTTDEQPGDFPAHPAAAPPAGPRAQPTAPPGPEPSQPLRWTVVDHSAHGLGLMQRDSEQQTVRIGELVAVRIPARSTDWTVGYIRRAQINDDGNLEIGIYKLGQAPQPVLVRSGSGQAPASIERYDFALYFTAGGHTGQGPP